MCIIYVFSVTFFLEMEAAGRRVLVKEKINCSASCSPTKIWPRHHEGVLAAPVLHRNQGALDPIDLRREPGLPKNLTFSGPLETERLVGFLADQTWLARK